MCPQHISTKTTRSHTWGGGGGINLVSCESEPPVSWIKCHNYCCNLTHSDYNKQATNRNAIKTFFLTQALPNHTHYL